VEWRALFHGSIVGKLGFDSTELVFTKDKVELGDVRKDTTDFRQLLKKFMPLKVNRLRYIMAQFVTSTTGQNQKLMYH
jgi:hypothetical protein